MNARSPRSYNLTANDSVYNAWDDAICQLTLAN